MFALTLRTNSDTRHGILIDDQHGDLLEVYLENVDGPIAFLRSHLGAFTCNTNHMALLHNGRSFDEDVRVIIPLWMDHNLIQFYLERNIMTQEETKIYLGSRKKLRLRKPNASAFIRGLIAGIEIHPIPEDISALDAFFGAKPEIKEFNVRLLSGKRFTVECLGKMPRFEPEEYCIIENEHGGQNTFRLTIRQVEGHSDGYICRVDGGEDEFEISDYNDHYLRFDVGYGWFLADREDFHIDGRHFLSASRREIVPIYVSDPLRRRCVTSYGATNDHMQAYDRDNWFRLGHDVNKFEYKLSERIIIRSIMAGVEFIPWYDQQNEQAMFIVRTPKGDKQIVGSDDGVPQLTPECRSLLSAHLNRNIGPDED